MFLAPKISRTCAPVLADPRFSFNIPFFFRSQEYHQSTTFRNSFSSTGGVIESNMSPYTTSNRRDCLNTTKSYNTVSNYYTVGNDLSPLLTWLSPLDPGLRHSDIRERRVGNVGEWLTRTEKFRRWCGLGGEVDGNAVLFCYGNTGVGKTSIR